MITLLSTDKLIAYMAEAKTTTEPTFDVAFYDNKSGETDVAESTNFGSLNSTTDVELVTAPAATYNRNVTHIVVCNIDTVAHTIVVAKDVSGTDTILFKISLQPNESWQYPVEKIDCAALVGKGTVIAYATDDSGTNFTTTFNSTCQYIGIISTSKSVDDVTAADFTGKWKFYAGTGNAFSYSDMLPLAGYVFGTDGIANSVSVSGVGTVTDVLKNGSSQSFPFSFAATDVIRVIATGYTPGTSFTIEGIFSDTTKSVAAVGDFIDNPYEIESALNDFLYFSFLGVNNTTVVPALFYIKNKATGVTRSMYFNGGLPLTITYDSLSGMTVVNTNLGTNNIIIYYDNGTTTVLTNGLGAGSSNLYPPIFYTIAGTRYFYMRDTEYNATTLAVTRTGTIYGESTSAWNAVETTAAGYIYVNNTGSLTSIYKVSLNNLAWSATISIATINNNIQFLNKTPISNLLWFTGGKYVASLNVTNDAVTLYNTGYAITSTVYSYTDFNCMDEANGIIYAKAGNGTVLIIFDTAAGTYSVVNLAPIIGANFLTRALYFVDGSLYIACFIGTFPYESKLVKYF